MGEKFTEFKQTKEQELRQEIAYLRSIRNDFKLVYERLTKILPWITESPLCNVFVELDSEIRQRNEKLEEN